jgi:uncharacterized surface protein with fasciclin (FAS1) repeats
MKKIIDKATETGRFKTMMDALAKAGMADTLNKKGPFTVFAPVDAAFDKLPPGTMDSLLQDLPKLQKLLNYHVVVGKVNAKEMSKMSSARTVEGDDVAIKATFKDGILINDARVIDRDIKCKNGVIQAIDKVIIPT